MSLVNVELHGTVVTHLQQERLAVVLILDVHALHDVERLQRFFAKGNQNLFSISHWGSLHRSRRRYVLYRSSATGAFAWTRSVPDQKAEGRAIYKSVGSLNRPLQIDEFSLPGPCRAPQRLRRLAEGADEGAPHALGIAESSRLRDELDRLARGLHALARDLDAQALDGLRGRRAGLGGKGAGKMPRAHAGAISEIFDRQAGVEVLARPGQQRTEAAVRRLQFQ